MRKIILLIAVLSVLIPPASASYIDKQLKEVKKNTKYNSVQKYKRSYETPVVQVKNVENLKDPKLIKLSEYTLIDEKDYQAKLDKDEAVYKKNIQPTIDKNMNSINIEPAAVDFYKIYRISERLIRANNLDYVNWRIAIRKSEDVNAASFNGNYIRVNTALYDSLHTSDDALAFVLAHEMSHQILGHNQRLAQLSKKLKKYNAVESSRDKSLTDLPNLTVSTFGLAGKKVVYNEMQKMEYMADSEAIILLTRAGYSPNKAMEALYTLDALPNVEYFLMTHPLAKNRIESAEENISILNPDWVLEGKENIYNSEVLPCKKSSDRVSIVLTKSQNPKKFYEPEDIETRLKRIAYINYLHGNMDDAIKYFNKLGELTVDYVPYLYISYANEYLYNQSKDEKYLKNALKSIEKAKELNPQDKYVNEQYKEIENL